MKKNLILLFLIFSFKGFSQQNYEYIGVLKLKGNSKMLISYRLVFFLNGNLIKGYSISDLSGENETKNEISGFYNKKDNMFSFKEQDIIYTKSKTPSKDFCLINFAGKSNIEKEKSKISGSFTGRFQNNIKCIDGDLELIKIEKINKIVTKLNKKIIATKRVNDAVKKKVNPIKIMDSLKINNLRKNENLNVFAKSNLVLLTVWDSKIEDGDIVDIYFNNHLILTKYRILNTKKTLPITLKDGENIIKIVAISEGYEGENTSEILISDGSRKFELVSSLKKGESSTITILKN